MAVQEDHATPKPVRRFSPTEFVPWVETLLARGHRVYVVYEACGFGFGLCRQLTALGRRVTSLHRAHSMSRARG